jgi:beta-glucosidase
LPYQFPDDFIWGSATSSFQIEGAAHRDGRGPSIWDTFCAEPGRVRDDSNGDVACNHYDLFADDVALMADLGLSAYRFSIAWPRIVPDGDGEINEAGLDFYDRLVDELLAANITPYPTLYHWDLPQALQDKGGWTNRETAYAFARYAEAIIERLGSRIGTWSTLNEPFVSADHGYVTGEHAPGRTSRAEGLAAAHHLLLGHGLAVERIRALAPHAKAAIVLNFTPTEPATDSAADRELAVHLHNWENRWYIDPVDGKGYPAETVAHFNWDQAEVHDGDMDIISAPIDVLGVNYYTRQFASADDSFVLPPEAPRNTMGWELYAPGLGWLLRWLRDDYSFASYMITENGCPMPDELRLDGHIVDDDRLEFVRDHLIQVHDAIADGCPVQGYLVWSLFDNFEWAYGYGPKFGIVEVDFETLERRPKKSAHWFRDAARANGFL